ncbi:CotH kinase family protein [Sporosarcina luteola]|uniref:CotH kinase family protein n=1 Tax=Sporosarcina luteola TaxID=582850 RepID=UPI00203F8BAF|nr:CotH kinase family protein [Sporosarcina luteola]MCM3744752.1 CotH kinase family protein [Sporosarcina luteola]
METIEKLPEYRLFIHPLDLNELRKDIWIDDPVSAKLTIHGKKYEVDIAYRGSHIRDFPKKSYHVSFYKPSTYRNAKALHLNAEFKDPSMIRNKLSFDFFNEIGCLAPQARFVFLKVNGRNEGVYLELESVDDRFLANRKLPDGSIFYGVDGDANFSLMSDLDKEVKKSLTFGYEQQCGAEEDANHLQKMIIDINTIPREEFEKEIVDYINVDKYLRWLAGVVFTQNFDGFVHNYALYRNKESGLYEIIPWDYDATWGRDVNGEEMDSDYLRITGFNTLTARILDVKKFRNQYKSLVQDILRNQFTVDYLKPKIQRMHALLRPYLLLDPYKKDSIDHFDREPDYIFNFIEERSAFIKREIVLLD